MQTDFLFLVWLAGFVDGEGCITLRRQKNNCGNPTYSPSLTIAQSDRVILDLIAGQLGAGGVYPRRYYKHAIFHRKVAWQYTVGGPAALRIVAALQPYLIVKREQADALLTFQPIAQGVIGPRSEQATRYAELRKPQEAIYLRLRELKGNPTNGRKRA